MSKRKARVGAAITAFLLSSAGCDSERPSLAATWCEEQSTLPMVPYPGIAESESAACSQGTVIWDGGLRCRCTTVSDCPDARLCRDSVCVPADHCTIELDGFRLESNSACLDSVAELEGAHGDECAMQFESLFHCMVSYGPFCTSTELETACGGARMQLTSCVGLPQ